MAVVVEQCNLEIADGEFLILLGPSDCGKSTTLRMIAAVESITHSDLTIGGKRVNDSGPKDRGASMMFQNYALHPDKSVSDNMALKLQEYQRPRVPNG